MRIRQYAAIIASAAIVGETVAKPVEFGSRRGGMNKHIKVDVSKNKYFQEPGGDEQLGHYDQRYFHGIVSYEERTDTQLHMIRAYLNFFRGHGLDTWIAHGTLLGWWWNGQRLPWDWDMDTQVSGATLHYLGENFNQTRENYTSSDGSVTREYLIDVNPWIWERERGDGMNVIDARFIDVRNGLFIDITGLSETHPDQSPGVWSCKNYHRYHTSDLYPMRTTYFEGVEALVPYAYDKILIEEYKEKALVLTEYEGHQWNAGTKAWEKTPGQIAKEQREAEARQKKADREENKRKEEEQKKKDEEAKKKEEEGSQSTADTQGS
ncbi:LicD family-domain-containing protein [Lophiotrema nucula]|uniref:LicD family-domain-containing protein n=1 Tax=Lophiotrema nucula TaxID=690887 RepID=A0A6A5ZKE6_9PLEO|nr:LicD family-domain-containing protein [Lophiotrema nucula]